MRFAILPPELQEATLALLPEDTLPSLCLVSKSILALARPLLYRSLELDFPFPITRALALDEKEESNVEKDEEEEVEERRQGLQARLCETLKAHPERCSHVRSLELWLDVTKSLEEVQTAQLFASFTNLRDLEIVSYSALDRHRRRQHFDKICQFLVEHCPPTLVSLDMKKSKLLLRDIYQILGKLPLLETLWLGFDVALVQPSTPLTLPTFSNLRTLHLSGSLPSRPFIATLQAASPALKHLHVDLDTVLDLDRSRLSSIVHLDIRIDVFLRAYRPEARWAQHFQEIGPALEACTSLQSFEFSSNLSRPTQPQDVHEGYALSVLHRLPDRKSVV